MAAGLRGPCGDRVTSHVQMDCARADESALIPYLSLGVLNVLAPVQCLRAALVATVQVK